MNKIAIAIIFCLLIPACIKLPDINLNLPFVYRVDIQQGNVLEQSAIDQLTPGMSKTKVQFLLGNPLLIDPFHANRWEYIDSIRAGNTARAQRRITLFFKEDELTHITGDVIAIETDRSEINQTTTSSIILTEERKNLNVFSKLLGIGKPSTGPDTAIDDSIISPPPAPETQPSTPPQ